MCNLFYLHVGAVHGVSQRLVTRCSPPVRPSWNKYQTNATLASGGRVKGCETRKKTASQGFVNFIWKAYD